MSLKAERRLNRAQAEGVLYKLPDDEQSRVFEEKVSSLRHEPGILLEVLHLAQETYGHLTKPVLGWIAQELKVPRSDVYSAATFYSMFTLKPEPRYGIRVCDWLSCYLRGGEAVLDAIRNEARIQDGVEVSEDGLFSLQTVSCLGLCDQAPAMMVNRARYGFLTSEKARRIISDLRSGGHIA